MQYEIKEVILLMPNTLVKNHLECTDLERAEVGRKEVVLLSKSTILQTDPQVQVFIPVQSPTEINRAPSLQDSYSHYYSFAKHILQYHFLSDGLIEGRSSNLGWRIWVMPLEMHAILGPGACKLLPM